MANVKTFSTKSNAKRAAAKVGITEDKLVQVDGKWGFEVVEAIEVIEVTTPAAKPRSAGTAFDILDKKKPAAKQVEEVQTNAEEEVNAEVASLGANPFGGMTQALVSKPAQVQPESSNRESKRTCAVEKDRPEQNGIKRPSSGGLCRAVWDKCDEMREANGGVIPTSKEVKAAAEQAGWNFNNAMIEFYQWRKFNGITGRAKKAE